MTQNLTGPPVGWLLVDPTEITPSASCYLLSATSKTLDNGYALVTCICVHGDPLGSSVRTHKLQYMNDFLLVLVGHTHNLRKKNAPSTINHQSHMYRSGRMKSSVISHQSSVISHQLAVISHQSSVISHQSPTTNHQPPTTFLPQ